MLLWLKKYFIYFTLPFLILWGLPFSAKSQTPKAWSNLGLFGGHIYDVAIDPSNPDKMFAGSYLGDGLFVSTDGGRNWQAVETENEPEGEGTFKNHAVWAVEVAPDESDVIWVAHNRWVEKSTDGGRTWTHIYNRDMQQNCANCGGADDDNRFCRSLVIDPADFEIVYVGTGGPNETDTSGAIFKTVDGGTTWLKMNQGNDFDFTVVDIDVDPQDNNVVWAVTNSSGEAGVWGGTLYRSGDGGNTWSSIFSLTPSGAGYFAVAVKPDDSNTVFTGSGPGIIKHNFDGSNWTFVWPVEGDSSYVQDLSFDPQNPETLYASWYRSNDPGLAVGRSTDGGNSWEIYPQDYYFESLTVHPTNSEVIFAGEFNEGIFKSQDHGQTWTSVNKGINAVIVYDVAIDPNDSTHILAATFAGLYEKIGAGTWSLLVGANSSVRSVLFHPTDSQTFYAGLEGSLAKTIDGGQIWTFSNRLGPDGWNYVSDIAIDPTSTDTIFIAVDGFGNYGEINISTDAGNTFTKVLDGINQANENYPFNVVKIDPSDNQHIFAGGGSYFAPKVLGDLLESADGGDNWMRTGLQNEIINALLINPDDPKIMYAGCGYSGGTAVPVYKSTDGGATWTPSHTGIPGLSVILGGLWGSSATRVFAAGSGGQIFRYNGSDWPAMASGTSEKLNDVWGSSPTNVFAVGDNGIIRHYNGRSWGAMDSGTTFYLNSVWGISATDFFAVGGYGTILHYDGRSWSALSSGTTEELHDVWGNSATDVFAVGDNGTILHYNGSRWTPWNAGTTENLLGIWGTSSTDIFAVGTSGTIVRYEGTSWIWTVMNSGTAEDLDAVWGASSTDVFAAGNDGVIRHFDGRTWTGMVSGTTEYLTGIWGAGGNTVFVCGDMGSILRYDGQSWSTSRTGGSRWNAVTDLAFHRQNPNIVYASTSRAGVYISPNQADNWLNLGTPAYNVYAVSAASLFAATDGGLLQCNGTGVIAGKVVQAGSQKGIDGARIFTDSGARTRSAYGEYMMVCPSGIHTVAVIADGYANLTAENEVVLGADVSWVDVAMKSGVSDPSLNFDGNNNSSSGGGSYCFIGSAAF